MKITVNTVPMNPQDDGDVEVTSADESIVPIV
jgi:hypothetical protein